MNQESTRPYPTRSRSADITAAENSRGFHAEWLLATLISIPLVATLFWSLGSRYFESNLSLFEYQQFAVLIAGVTAGGYQLYFWVQRNNGHFPAKCMKIPLDDQIPFWPRWVWLYSIFHFVMIGLTIVSIQDPADGVHLIFGGLMVLLTGNVIFYFFPTYVPESFRLFEVNSLSTRYLAFIQSMDNNRNAFPSMHCAIATYVGLAIVALPTIGPSLGYGYIAVTTISCLLVKQHVLIDTLAGTALGAGMFYANEWFAGLISRTPI